MWLGTALDWDNMSELDKLPAFGGIVDAMIGGSDEWREWYMSGRPEAAKLPGDWEEKVGSSELLRMCLLRAVRSDRVLFSA